MVIAKGFEGFLDLPWVQSLSDEQLAEVLQRIDRVLLYREDTFTAPSLLIIPPQSSIALYQHDGGSERVLYDIISTGDEARYVVELLSGEVSIRSRSKLPLCAVPSREIDTLVRIAPGFGFALLGAYQQSLERSLERQKELRILHASERIWAVIMTMAQRRVEVGLEPILRLTHDELGQLANTSRETATRTISALTNEGVVKKINHGMFRVVI